MQAGKTSLVPTEVELALEVMPCQADRRVYEPADRPHPCTYFARWGVYHSYGYESAGPPASPGIRHPAVYRGKTALVPEILSGCRKAPIMAVGINPNLPGWWPASANALNPVFDDVLEYVHYFRYRAVQKLEIPRGTYDRLLRGRKDGPQVARPLVPIGSRIPTQLVSMSMYQAYQGLLDELAARRGWVRHALAVGEDLAYGNMVACPSAKWLSRADPQDPEMPVMSPAVMAGIVEECFQSRRHFLRQLFQSLPAVLLVFSEATATAFISAMEKSFTSGAPRPGEPIPALLSRRIVLSYGRAPDGEPLEARVIFTPHATGDPQAFAAQREKVVAALVEEAQAGRIALNPATGHLARPRGGCLFCANTLYRIGPCDYQRELRPLGPVEPGPGAEIMARPEHVASERAEQERLLDRFLERARPPRRVAHGAKSNPFRIMS